MHNMLGALSGCNITIACWVRALFICGLLPELLLMPRFQGLPVRSEIVPFLPWAGLEAMNARCRVPRVRG